MSSQQKLFYLINGEAQELIIDDAKEAVKKADEIAEEYKTNVYIYTIKDGIEAEDYWYSGTWGW